MASKKEKQLLFKDTGPRDVTNREIVEEFIANGLLDECVMFQLRKLPPDDRWKRQFRDDLFQLLALFLLEYDHEKLLDAYTNRHMNALVTRILINQLWSRSSAFYVQNCKFHERNLPITSPEFFPDHEDE